MTEYNKAIAAGVASPLSLAAAQFLGETLRLYEFPEPMVASAMAFVVAAVNVAAVWSIPDARLKRAHTALGKKRLETPKTRSRK